MEFEEVSIEKIDHEIVHCWMPERVKTARQFRNWLDTRPKHHNGVIKYNEDGEVIEEIYFANVIDKNKGKKIKPKRTKEQQEALIYHASEEEKNKTARQRAKRKMKDLLNANDDLNLFITLTLDPNKIDRYNIDEIYKKLHCWLNNAVKRRGLKYIIVPEYHKDKKGIHFHGIINEVFPLRESGKTTDKKQIIYNLPNWTLGFSTAIKIDNNRLKCFNYIIKYINKSSDKIGGRWFYSGGKLKRLRAEKVTRNYENINAEERIINVGGYEIKYKKIERRKINE